MGLNSNENNNYNSGKSFINKTLSKVLEKIQGLSIIELIVKRLKTKFADDIIVAIPNNTENKILKNI